MYNLFFLKKNKYYTNMYSEQEERKYVNYLAKAKQDGPKQTFTRDPAPTNLE